MDFSRVGLYGYQGRTIEVVLWDSHSMVVASVALSSQGCGDAVKRSNFYSSR